MNNSSIKKNLIAKSMTLDELDDLLFQFHRWQTNLRILDIKEIKSVPYTLISHPFVERLIGTIRLEHLDRLFFGNQHDLEKKLKIFQGYYNERRAHSSLQGELPAAKGRKGENIISLHKYGWKSHCNNLFNLPIAA